MLLEVLIGGLIIAIAAVGVAKMFADGQTTIHHEGDHRVAVFLATQRIEQMRAMGTALIPSVPVTETVTLTPAGSDSRQVYTRTSMVVCVLPDDYARIMETCLPAMWATSPKYMVVCVVAGSVVSVCDPPESLTARSSLTAAARRQPSDPVILYAVLTPH
jgi:Tfp pilus assembly protein PilV